MVTPDDEDEDEDDGTEFPLEKRSQPQFDEHARAIGYVCKYWAWLEYILNLFLEYFIPLKPGKLSDGVLANIDFREKIQMALAVGYMRRRDDGWFEMVREHLNFIDNELRAARNRVVHDEWRFGYDSAVFRIQKKTRFVKRGSFKPAVLETKQSYETPDEDVWELSNAIYDATSDLASFIREMVISSEEWPRARLPRRYRRPNTTDVPRRKKSGEAP